MDWPARTLVGLLVLAAPAAFAAAPATMCVSGIPAAGCSAGRALDHATWVTVAPDGRNVYVGAENTGAVATFARNRRSGRLRQLAGTAGCVSQDGVAGCARGRGLAGTRPVTVSPDGRYAYAGARSGLAVFARSARTGALTQLPGAAGCLSVNPGDDCASARGTQGVTALAVSRDGRFLYAAARSSSAVTVFARSRRGPLRQLRGAAGCLAQTTTAGCGRGRGLTGPRGVVLSPDGRFAYFVTEDGDSLAAFRRDRRGGRLRQLEGRAGCLQAAGREGCRRAPKIILPHHAVISGDGRFMYVASDTIGTIVVLRRDNRSGRLAPLAGDRGCIASPRRAPCRRARGLTNAHSLALAPDGRALFAVGRGAHAIAVLRRNSRTGALAQPRGARGCFTSGDVAPCTPAAGLGGVHSVAASPDGRDIYGAGEVDNSVVWMRLPR